MKFDITTPVRDILGKPIMEPIDAGGTSKEKPVLLATYIVGALLNAANPDRRQQPVSEAEHTRRFLLAIKLGRALDQGSGIVKIEVKDRDTIKACAAAVHPSLIVGQIVAVLDEDGSFATADEAPLENTKHAQASMD